MLLIVFGAIVLLSKIVVSPSVNLITSSTKELKFKRKQLNSLYVQNSRGKFELELIGALKQPMLDIRKFSWDVSLFLSQEFNLLSLPPIYSTGSSIMPNKSNPDVIEIMRANYSILAGHYSELENLIEFVKLSLLR